MKKLKRNFKLALLMIACFVMPARAQFCDGFFKSDNNSMYRTVDDGITIEGMNNENPTAPLGDGVLIMLVAGLAYAVARRKSVTKRNMLIIMAVMLLSMTQCKKKTVSTIETKTAFMTFETSRHAGRTVFVPGMEGDGFTWNGEGYEYISVGGSIQGYLGELRAETSGGNVQTERVVFGGNIIAPEEGEDVYFFYLGNGSHAAKAGDVTTTIDFSNQPDGTTSTVTNLLIAIEKGTITKIDETTYHAYANLKVKTAIAFFELDGFESSKNQSETIYLHGDDLYSSAVINYKEGTITGNAKGFINVGTNGDKYVALIASTDNETVLKFDSNSKSGEITFPNGIRKKKFYSNDLSPLPVAVENLPDETLPGLFSVSPSVKVRFSKGNLQYTRSNTSANWDAEGSWHFMENQYDIAEVADQYDPSYASWYHDVGDDYSQETAVSFMGFGTTGKSELTYPYKNPYDTDAEYEYGPETGNLSVAEGTDWGWCIGGADSPWRTLSANEFSWLLGMANGNAHLWTENPGVNCRVASTVCGVNNARFTRARILDYSKTSDGINGMVLLPDDYTHPEGLADLNYINYFGDNDSQFTKANILTVEEWSRMEDAGAVFLPAAGQRYINWKTWDIVTYSTDVNIGGHYWTSTASSYSGRILFFDGGHSTFQTDMRLLGRSVRLVQDAK